MKTRRDVIAAACTLLVAAPAHGQQGTSAPLPTTPTPPPPPTPPQNTSPVPETLAPILNSSLMHRVVASSRFRYSFGESELLAAARETETAIIVHHGKTAPVQGYIPIYSLFEGLPLFTTKATSLEKMQSSQLKAIVSGQLTNWKDVGGADLPVKFVVREDGVWGRALAHMLAENGIEMPRGAMQASSYEQLAETGLKNPGTLILGLRDTPARWDGIAELELDEKKISSQVDNYAIKNRITVYLRQGSKRAIELGRELTQSMSSQAAADRKTNVVAPAVAKLNAALDTHEQK